MSTEKMRQAVIAKLQAKTEEVFRKELNRNRPNVLYVSANTLLQGNPNLKKLQELNPSLASKYIETFIKEVRNTPTDAFFNPTSPKEGGRFQVITPPDKAALVYINSSVKSKKQTDRFDRLSKDLSDASARTNSFMQSYAPEVGATWSNIAVNAGHVYQEGVEDSTPVLARAKAIKELLTETGLETGPRTKNVGFKGKGVDLAPFSANKRDTRSIKEVQNIIDDHVKAIKKMQLRYSASYEREIGTQGDILGELNAVMVIPQEHKINTDVISELEAKLGTQLSKIMRNIKYHHLQGSPNIIDMFTNVLRGVFKTGRLRPERYKTRAKATSKVKNVPKVKVKDVSNRIQLGIPKVLEPKKDISVGVLSIQNLINQVLHERIKQLMGKSTDPAVRLRYQSGRFAESAILLTLTRTQAGILAGSYTYMKSPYEVFAPGHRLANGSRDPSIYIEGAIRGAAISILKSKFPGIVLELD